MRQTESKRHHFVPKLLLRAWLQKDGRGQEFLQAYYWHQKSLSVKSKNRGMDAFCNQIDLLTLSHHKKGRDALERIFFGEVDDKGAKIKDILLKHGVRKLASDQRSDFARLLLSLEARRPVNVAKLRFGGKVFADGLNSDPFIRSEMDRMNIGGLPSELFEQTKGEKLEDRAMSIISRLVDNPKVGGVLINSNWGVFEVGQFDGSFILSDRPLIRTLGFDNPNIVWLLPLTPKVVFVATNNIDQLKHINSLAGQRLVKDVNSLSVGQAERFIFCKGHVNQSWLLEHLPRNH
jgi:hypothetical protein